MSILPLLIVSGCLACHDFDHGFVLIPKFCLGYKPAVVMNFNPMDQGLEPFDLHHSKNHPSEGGRPSGHALCHLGYVRVAVQLLSERRERVKTFDIDKGHTSG
jgi:hypothetical protein